LATKGVNKEGTKTLTIRLVVPKILVQRILSSFGPEAKTEVTELDLKTGGLTTENIVRYIRKYSKAKDDLLQAFRQLAIDRESNSLQPKLADLDATLQEVETKIGEFQNEYRRIAGESEGFEREALESEKRLTAVEQLATTGFSYEEMASRVTGFRRILGRIPLKKLEPALKALRVLLKDRVAMTTGAKVGDRVYLLIASPTDVVPQTLQTLLLYDFASVELPSLDGSDPKDALKASREKRDRLSREVAARKTEMDMRRHEWKGPLNNLADEIEETLLLLRSSLRLGEGTRAAHIFARLEKHPPVEVLNPLVSDGVMELD
jgi:vacuolar-type H+-ATPase subunit I/STV1